MTTVVCVIAVVAFYYAGYAIGWSDCRSAQRLED